MISPLLANVYLHEVLDTWCETVVQAHCRGKVVLYRYADDVVIGCEWEEDARRIKEVLPKRFAKYGLEINTEKTKLVDFGRPQRPSSGRKPGTFSFLGFVHYWGKTWRGGYTIKRKTEGKRLRRTLGAFWRWCRDNRHRPLQEQYAILCAKLRGYYQYYGIRCNSPVPGPGVLYGDARVAVLAESPGRPEDDVASVWSDDGGVFAAPAQDRERLGIVPGGTLWPTEQAGSVVLECGRRRMTRVV